jgi:hypothetical protein
VRGHADHVAPEVIAVILEIAEQHVIFPIDRVMLDMAGADHLQHFRPDHRMVFSVATTFGSLGPSNTEAQQHPNNATAVIVLITVVLRMTESEWEDQFYTYRRCECIVDDPEIAPFFRLEVTSA